MKSIRKTLTRRLSIIISLLVIAVLLAADIGVDSWVEQEFNQAMKAKVGVLQSLVNEDVEGVEFEFAGEYLPEFEGRLPQYFQLVQRFNVEKSDTRRFIPSMNCLSAALAWMNILSRILLCPMAMGRVIYLDIYLRLILKMSGFYASWAGNDTRPSMVIARNIYRIVKFHVVVYRWCFSICINYRAVSCSIYSA